MHVIITVFFCRTAPDWNCGKEDGLFSPITACIIIKVYHFFYSVYFKWNVFKCSHFPFQAEWTDSGSLERLKCLSKPVSPDSREESVLGSIPLPSYRILYCSPRECRNRKYAFKVSASSCWSSLNLNVLMSRCTLVPVGCSSGDAAVHHERWNPGGHVGLGQGSQPISKHGGWWHHQQVNLSSQSKIAPFVGVL